LHKTARFVSPSRLDSSQAETNLRQQLRPTVVKRAAVEAPAAPLPTLSSLQRASTRRRASLRSSPRHRGGCDRFDGRSSTRSHPIDDRAMAEPVRHDSQGASVCLITARVVATPARGPPEAHIAARAAESLTRTPGAIAVELPDGGGCSHPPAAIRRAFDIHCESGVDIMMIVPAALKCTWLWPHQP